MTNKYLLAYGFLILLAAGVIISLNQKKPTNPFDSTPISFPTLGPTPLPTAPPTQPPPSITKLTTIDAQIGTGSPAASKNIVTVNYTGMLIDGKVFDSSVGKQPFTFEVGTGKVIPGWDQGILGMRVGGKRRLIIPPDLAYGEKGIPGAIPPNSALIFDVELLDVK